MMRKGRKVPSRWCAVACSVAVVWAITYCNVETFVPHATASEGSQHHASSDHAAPELPPSDHHDDSTLHCETILNVVTAQRLEVHVSSRPTGVLRPLVWAGLESNALLELPHVASGLSPPTREPPPARPFYRTTFASHAPPVCLA